MVQIMFARTNTVFDGGIGIRNTGLDSVDQCFDVALYCIRQNIVALPYRSDFETVLIEANFEVQNALSSTVRYL